MHPAEGEVVEVVVQPNLFLHHFQAQRLHVAGLE